MPSFRIHSALRPLLVLLGAQGLLLHGTATSATQLRPVPGDLVINEIHYAPADSKLEFVELFNRSDKSIDLCTLTLADSRDEPVSFCEAAKPLPPEGFALIARDTMLLKAEFQLPSDVEQQGLVLSPTSWPALNNSGDTVTLYADTTVIDAVAYTPDWGGQRVSLERIDPAGPAMAFNWGSSVDQQGATPGYQNSIYNPDSTAPALVLAEQTTQTTFTLFWDEPLELGTLLPDQFEVDARAPERVISLSDTSILLQFSSPVSGAVLHHEGVQDRTGNAGLRQQHPVAVLPIVGDIKINEIMFAPLADAFDNKPDQPEYVELYNASDQLLSLRHLALAGEVDDAGVADTLRSTTAFPVLTPGAFALYFAPGQNNLDTVTFEAAFPGMQSAAPLLLPVDATSLGLRNEGDRAAVVLSNNFVLEELVYQPSWHHPLLEETRGRALERRAPTAPVFLPSNWSSAVTVDGGTPGRKNSVHQTTDIAMGNSRLVINPSLFSPNGDGIDDVLTIQVESEKASQAGGIKVFDLAGRRVRTLVETTLFQQREIRFWDGVSDSGKLLPVGVYIVVVNLLDVSAGTTQQIKQPVILARQLR